MAAKDRIVKNVHLFFRAAFSIHPEEEYLEWVTIVAPAYQTSLYQWWRPPIGAPNLSVAIVAPVYRRSKLHCIRWWRPPIGAPNPSACMHYDHVLSCPCLVLSYLALPCFCLVIVSSCPCLDRLVAPLCYPSNHQLPPPQIFGAGNLFLFSKWTKPGSG